MEKLGKKRENHQLEDLEKKRRRERYKPLPTTDGTHARMFLLFLHLLEDGLFFDLDEISSFFF